MLYIYLSCAILLLLIVIFYYKFNQNKKEQDKLLKMVAEKNEAHAKELKDFQDFVLNGFQHLSKDIESNKPQSTDNTTPPEPEIEMENFEINDELPSELKDKINNLNSDKDNEFDSDVNVTEPLEEENTGSAKEENIGSAEEDVVGSAEEDDVGSAEEENAGYGSGSGSGSGSDEEDDSIQINNPSLELLTLKELQEIARSNNLAIRGPKKDLIQRIKNNKN